VGEDGAGPFVAEEVGDELGWLEEEKKKNLVSLKKGKGWMERDIESELREGEDGPWFARLDRYQG
jgi:hypothetical protein